MRICLKKKTVIDGKTLEKHQEGFILGTKWGEQGDFEYLVDFSEFGVHYVAASDVDVLNC